LTELKEPVVQKSKRPLELVAVSRSLENWGGLLLGHRWLLGLLICLFVVESRLYTVKRFGVQEPYMDSFSEVYDYKPAVQGDWGLVLANSLRPNNEHRIVLTRWTNIGLFLLDGEKWDLLSEACFNAVLAGLLAAALLLGVGRYFTGRAFLFFAFLLVLAFGLPVSYENIIWGFQSQHFYFLLFSVVAISCTVGVEPLSRVSWIGLLAGALSCLTLASGFFGLVSILVVFGLMALRREYRSRGLALTAIICLLLLVATMPLLFGVPSDPSYRARSAVQFLSALAGNLAWPNIEPSLRGFGILIQLPFLALTLAALVRSQALPRSSYVIVGLGVFNAMIAVTLAYARGAYVPYVRYFDYNALNLVVNGAALLELGRLGLFPQVTSVWKRILFLGWVAAATAGCWLLAGQAWNHGLPDRKAELINERRAIHTFLRTHDPEVLASPDLNGTFPFDEKYAKVTASWLSDPDIYRFLPNAMKPEFGLLDNHEFLSEIRRGVLRRSDFFLVGVSLLIALVAGAMLFADRSTRDFLPTLRDWMRERWIWIQHTLTP
jgi:hypothetical protein